MKTWQLFLASLAVYLLPSSLGLAQSNASPESKTSESKTSESKGPESARPAATVQAFGEQSMELPPERVRLLLVAQAEGATAKEAIERLSKHKEAVRDELTAMKAEADSIKITSADMRHHILGVPTQYQHMNAKFFTNLLEGSLNLRIEDLPTVHTASCVIEADWLLKDNSPELVLQLPNVLREEASQRDLIGEDNALELSPEQAANISKFKAAMDEHMGFYDDTSHQSPTVQALYVAHIKPAVRAAALKSAFEKAKQECELLAAASGHKLGRLVNLSKSAPDESSSAVNYSSMLESNDALSARLSKATPRDEITAVQAENLQARVQVRAVFELE